MQSGVSYKKTHKLDKKYLLSVCYAVWWATVCDSRVATLYVAVCLRFCMLPDCTGCGCGSFVLILVSRFCCNLVCSGSASG
jgi:hypothetical protein